MKEIKGDMFKNNICGYDAICITTNGIIKNNGKAVMGAGVAKICRDKYKGSDINLANTLKKNGNHVNIFFLHEGLFIISFPTKNNWRDKSDIDLIKRSALELEELVNKCKFERVLLPRPGCTNGKLNWEDVKAVIEPILSDKITIISL